MKKVLGILLSLGWLMASGTLTFAQEPKQEEKKEMPKKKGGKKKKKEGEEKKP